MATGGQPVTAVGMVGYFVAGRTAYSNECPLWVISGRRGRPALMSAFGSLADVAGFVTVDRCGPVSGHRHARHRLMSP